MAIPLQYDIFARDRASGTFHKLGRSMDQANRSSRTFGRSFAAAGVAVGRAAVGATAALGAMGAAGTVMGVRTAASLQQARIGFETLLGSAVLADKFLKQMTGFAARTPFRVEEIIQYSRALLGAGKAAKEVVPTLTAWGDAAGALGLNQEQFGRAMMAVTQIMNKGKVQSEELLQISEAGLPIWPLLAKAMGKPIPVLQAMMKEGKLLSADVLPRLEAQMGKDYGGAMAKQSKTLTGLWSTFMDTLNLGLANAIQPLVPVLQNALPGAMKAMGVGLVALSEWIRGTAMPAFAQLRDFLSAEVLPRLRIFGAFIRADLWPALVGFAQAAIPVVLDALNRLAGAFSAILPYVRDTAAFLKRNQEVVGPLAVGLTTYAGAVWAVTRATQAWAAAQVAVNAALLTNPYIAAAAAVAAVAAGMVAWSRSTGTVHDAFITLGKVATTVTWGIGRALSAVINHSLQTVQTFLKGLQAVVSIGGLVDTSLTKSFGRAAAGIEGAQKHLDAFDRSLDAMRHRVISIGIQFVSEGNIPSGQSLRGLAEGRDPGPTAPSAPRIAPGADKRIADRLRDQAKAIGNAVTASYGPGTAAGVGSVGSGLADEAKKTGKDVGEGLAKGIESTADKVAAAAQKLADEAKAKFDEIKAAAESLKESVKSSVMGFFTLQTEGNPFAGLTSMANKAVAFAGALAKLVKQGVNPSVIAMIAQAGPDVGLRAAQMLSTAGKANRNKIDNAYERIENAANRAGNVVANATYGDELAVARKSEQHLARIANAVDRRHKSDPVAAGWAAY